MTTVDVNVPRFNQACVAVLTGLAFVLSVWPIVPAVAVVLLVDRLAGPRYGLFSAAYARFVRPRIDGAITMEPAAPPRFAQDLGIVMLVLASAAFASGLSGLGWVLTLVVTGLATLAAATKVCVGCLIYERVAP
jgi:hypothetical protein